MTPHEANKRKACKACTTAKAKCSPYERREDLCQRCERLDKECVYEESQRKRGPRTRSRMKQLEQRVESLMDMLASNGQTPTRSSMSDNTTPVALINSNNVPNIAANQVDPNRPSRETPKPTSPDADVFTAYDPIKAGILNEDQADELLNDFRDSFTQHFPFVVVDASINASTLRLQQPFLFLSIMAATAYSTPTNQRILAEEFRDQVAIRIIGRAHKGLEILQGLLVHTAYYQYFYEPGKQQLALMMQLCVAMMQDLGLSKNTRKLLDTDSTLERAPAEKRAILGTYYLAAEFAHTWRKRTTMPYTRALARHCQSFADRPEHPPDVLIAPLVRLSELKCRISDYFSYDEIEFSEINGDSTLDLSTGNFRSELQRLEESLPEVVRQNTTIRLTCDVLGVWIHECSLHSTLWNPLHSVKPTTITPTRVRMLQRTFTASQTFLQNLLNAPSNMLHHYTFPIWGGWFYSTLVFVKLIFLHDSGGSGALGMDNLIREVGDILPRTEGESVSQDVCMINALPGTASCDSMLAAREAEVIKLFQEFVNKAILAAARYTCDSGPEGKSLLRLMATLQQGLLAGIKKKIEKQKPRVPPYAVSGLDAFAAATATPLNEQQPDQQTQVQTVHGGDPVNFNHYDDATLLDGPQVQIDDWMWDLVMEDVNMFTM
ncbi:uncharacterized protein K460DRAFT_364856 [Cucurbitaria berberidis CBS 394.84]|uniref:Zn(2)-C6 fungal-type domain-containing protein n=1 Tax=Cucurbitaria berberidis CBS 394.84 TaxID=1168544 RepID=A0A9P4LC18_9PLEO|nr:uncharacterized protein K460DRAFT_364856 [Cucurbitaria berberidis CBS 394.84]KAF1848917.1 hypothetical protein K460DRAFT_364856 [Cucurbitaria berberidis CBS 394.84]